MTTAGHLAQHGVSPTEARDFILVNLNNLQHILDVASEFGVTNQMLADIYDGDGGVGAADVVSFFASNGLDSNHLDAEPTIVGTWYTQDLSDGIGTQRITFNDNGSYSSIDTVSVPFSGEMSGIETGTYVWDEQSGALTVIVVNDQNGFLGLDGEALSLSLTGDQLVLTQGSEMFSYDKVIETEQHFTYEDLTGNVLYNVYMEDSGWESASFKFVDSANGIAGDGLNDSPSQYPFTYFVDGNGLLHMSWPEDGNHDVLGIGTHHSEPSEYEQLIWTGYDVSGDSAIDADLYTEKVQQVISNQSMNQSASQEYFFYDMASANLFMGT